MPASTWDIREVSVDPRPDGLRAVFMVGARSDVEVCEVEALFIELASRAQVRQLTRGRLVSYAVQAPGDDSDALDDVEAVLRKHYGFVAAHRSFNELIWRIVGDLAAATGSKALRMPTCNICGKIEPFPRTVVSLFDRGGRLVERRSYCGTCTAEACVPTNKEFVRSLLRADENGFAGLAGAQFVRRRKGRRMLRFTIQS